MMDCFGEAAFARQRVGFLQPRPRARFFRRPLFFVRNIGDTRVPRRTQAPLAMPDTVVNRPQQRRSTQTDDGP